LSRDLPQLLTDHLEDFRKRFINGLLWYFLFSILSFFFVDRALTWLAKPVGEFIFTSPTEALMIRFKIAFGLGLMISVPIILFQLWRFIEIALKESERSLVLSIVPASSILFYIGMCLALFGVAPKAIYFLIQFGSPVLKPLISIDAYLSFLFWMIIGFGILFQLPLVMVALCKAGLIKAATLAEYRRHIIVGIAIVAAFLTPGPDVFSQLLLGVPCYLLFEISLLICRRVEKK